MAPTAIYLPFFLPSIAFLVEIAIFFGFTSGVLGKLISRTPSSKPAVILLVFTWSRSAFIIAGVQ
jgi:hypothetical protein